MKTFTTALAGLIVAATVGLTALPAEAAVLLGCRKVNFGIDRDIIPVGKAAGRYAAIKLTVAQNAIEVFDVTVVYGNGNPDSLAVRSVIPAGGETRWIDLRGARRFLKGISLTYRSIPGFTGRATVCAFGR
jgi:Protein of unknown function (DUF2541)